MHNASWFTAEVSMDAAEVVRFAARGYQGEPRGYPDALKVVWFAARGYPRASRVTLDASKIVRFASSIYKDAPKIVRRGADGA